jgi:putative ABC transport system substrate-binding protein
MVARAQQHERMRRIGVLTNIPESDAQMQTRHGAFLEALQQLGWTPGRNVETNIAGERKLPTAIANMQRN